MAFSLQSSYCIVPMSFPGFDNIIIVIYNTTGGSCVNGTGTTLLFLQILESPQLFQNKKLKRNSL